MTAASAPVPALVLAAGESARLGRNKLLLPLAGKPVLHWVLDALLAAGLREVFVVIGHESELVRKSCERYSGSIAFVENLAYANGRATSIRAGLAVLTPEARGVLIAPGDVPFIGGGLLPQLLAEFEATGRITFPLVAGRKGHPVIFPAASFALLHGLAGDETLHDYLLTRPELVAAVAWPDDGCLLDIDSEDDLARAEAYLERR